jgi:hypothetical protein
MEATIQRLNATIEEQRTDIATLEQKIKDQEVQILEQQQQQQQVSDT